jgi:DNA-binding MarR family transcriptional regulator
MTIMTDDEEIRTKRRNISLTPSDDRRLERIADQHYQGNVSQCIRVAVNEHAEILDGGGDAAIRRIERDLRRLNEQVSDLGDRLSAIESRVESDEELDQFRAISGVSYQMARVYRALLREVESSPQLSQSRERRGGSHGEQGLRAEDLIERLELSPYDVLDALGELVDTGLVCERPDGETRYVPSLVQSQPEGSE